MLILLALPSPKGAAVITGTGWRRGGGPATWARWSMARASASTLDGARALKARGSSRSRRLPATTIRAQWGCIGACQKRRRRAVSDRTAAWRTSRTKNRAGRQATGILKHCEPVPGVLLPCSLTVRRPLPGNARGIWRASLPEGEVETAAAVRVRGRAISGEARSRVIASVAARVRSGRLHVGDESFELALEIARMAGQAARRLEHALRRVAG